MGTTAQPQTPLHPTLLFLLLNQKKRGRSDGKTVDQIAWAFIQKAGINLMANSLGKLLTPTDWTEWEANWEMEFKQRQETLRAEEQTAAAKRAAEDKQRNEDREKWSQDWNAASQERKKVRERESEQRQINYQQAEKKRLDENTRRARRESAQERQKAAPTPKSQSPPLEPALAKEWVTGIDPNFPGYQEPPSNRQPRPDSPIMTRSLFAKIAFASCMVLGLVFEFGPTETVPFRPSEVGNAVVGFGDNLLRMFNRPQSVEKTPPSSPEIPPPEKTLPGKLCITRFYNPDATLEHMEFSVPELTLPGKLSESYTLDLTRPIEIGDNRSQTSCYILIMNDEIF